MKKKETITGTKGKKKLIYIHSIYLELKVKSGAEDIAFLTCFTRWTARYVKFSHLKSMATVNHEAHFKIELYLFIGIYQYLI